ncbi:MAG: MFS transporter [Pyrinomonadaceae bacterium]
MPRLFQLIRIISPAIAGALVAWAGHQVCFYIDSLSFVLSAALLSTITLHRETIEAHKGIGSLPLELVEGLKFIAKHRAILFLTISMTAAILAMGAFDAVIVVYVRDILSADSRLFGTLISMVAVGTILGALLIGKFGQSWSRLYLVVLGIFGIGINVLILAVLSSVVATLVCSFGLGLSAACVLIPAQTLIQEESPPSMLGRVSSTSMSLMTAAQLGAFLIAGAVANWLGIKNLYYLVALTLILIAIVGYGFKRAIRITEASRTSSQT